MYNRGQDLLRRSIVAASVSLVSLAAAAACHGNGAVAGSDAGDAGDCRCAADEVCIVDAGASTCVPACESSVGCIDAATHDAAHDAAADAPVEVGPPVCTVGAQRCTADGLAVQTCNALGQWSAPWTCVTGTCSGASCGGTTTTATSCSASGPGLDDCGPAHQSCCTSVEVPGGIFDRMYAADGGGASGLADPATVSGFRLDVYDVTVARFRKFVAALYGSPPWSPAIGAGRHVHLHAGDGLGDSSRPGQFETGWAAGSEQYVNPTAANLACVFETPAAYTWTAAPGANEDKPINCINWYEAYTFCIWDGGFLPSETEWEYAAAAADQQREYPWGSEDPDGSTAYAIYGGNYEGDGGAGSLFAPVGTAVLGVGFWGHLDLAGEVWQWALDEDAPYVSPCHDCAYLTGAPNRIYRGGGQSNPGNFVPSVRESSAGSARLNVGVRCARVP